MSTMNYNGTFYRVSIEPDECMGEPWEEHDGYGVVSEWTTRSKRPGERVLCTDGQFKRYYDFAETCRIARRDGWNAEPYSTTETARQKAAKAVEADFRHLRAWCNDEWSWVGVVVTAPDGETASLWGIESSDAKYLQTVAAELAEELSQRPTCPHCKQVVRS